MNCLKMRNIFMLFLFVFLSAGFSQADSQTGSQAKPEVWPKSEWPELKLGDEITYEQLCEYDHLCKKLKTKNGAFKAPHPLILKLFWLQKDNLLRIAKKYGVHPILPIAAVATEHSLNVGIEDQVQSNLQALGADVNGKLLGLKAVSYGYGQLKKSAAMEAEQMVARIENRPPQSYKYVEKRIVSLEGAYEYIAALMSYYTEVYDTNGFDVSNNFGVLTTLYNIGKIEERVERTISQGRKPQVNYFGWFALNNWKNFEALYSESGFDFSYLADSQKTLQESENDSWVGKLVGLFIDDQVPTMATNKEVTLKDNPPSCRIKRENFVSIDNLEKREEDYLRSIENTQVQLDREIGSFDILSKGFDCLGRLWGLLEFSDTGRMGWLNLETAGKTIEMTNRPRKCEKKEVSSQCIGEVKNLLESKDDFLGYDEKTQFAYIRLGHNSLLETDEMTWKKNPSSICDNEEKLKEMQTEYKEIQSKKNNAESFLEEQKTTTHELTLQWIDHHNFKLTKKTRSAENALSNKINKIKQSQKINKQKSYAYILNKEDKDNLTPIVNKAIKKLESEVNIDLGFSDNNIKDDDAFLYNYLFWAYQYKEHCLASDRECILTVPMKTILEIGNDIIENGFHAKFVMETVIGKTIKKQWFHSVELGLLESKTGDQTVYTYEEMLLFMEAEISSISGSSNNYKVIIEKIHKQFEKIKDTELNKLKIYDDRRLSEIAKQFITIASYIEGKTAQTELKDCSILLSAPDGNSYFSQGKRINCKHFHLFKWSDEQLERIIDNIVMSLVNRALKKIKWLESDVEEGLSPPDPNGDRHHWRSEKYLKTDLVSCNYNYVKTFEVVEKLSTSSCVHSFLLPAEKLLNNKSREEEIYFNTMSFGDKTDRMAIKLKTTCD